MLLEAYDLLYDQTALDGLLMSQTLSYHDISVRCVPVPTRNSYRSGESQKAGHMIVTMRYYLPPRSASPFISASHSPPVLGQSFIILLLARYAFQIWLPL